MSDVFTKEKRSLIMSLIAGKHTKPEIIVRKTLFSLGYRYRLHVAKLPGKPDIVIGGINTVVFVNGCFWHRHNCGKNVVPVVNSKFWKKKLDDNVQRQKKNIRELKRLGWKPVVVWECQTKKRDKLINLLRKQL